MVAATKLRAVTRSSPCAVCSGDHKCSRGSDGLFVCGRCSGPQPGFVDLGVAKGDPQFRLYRSEGDPVLLGRQQARRPPPQRPNSPPPVDWPARAKQLADNLTPALADELCERLGIPSPYILTKSFDDTWFEFLSAWPQIKYPSGTGPLDEALRRTRERPLPPAALPYEDTRLQLLVALVVELQRMAGEQPFFLGCRSAGTLIGVGHTKANLWLRGLVADGVLVPISKGDKKTKLASEYRYIAPLD